MGNHELQEVIELASLKKVGFRFAYAVATLAVLATVLGAGKKW